MIIAYDVTHIRRHRAGIGRFNALILQGLLSTDRDRNYLLHAWSPDLDRETIQSYLSPNVRLSLAQVPGAVKRFYWNILRMPPLQTFIGPFDIFHSAEPLLPPVANKRSICTFYDTAYYRFPHFYSPWTARKWDYLYRRSVRKADAVIVPSRSTGVDLMDMMSLPPAKVHLVRPPIDPVFSGPVAPADESAVEKKFSLPDQYILFAGTLEPRKNISRLVKAFEMFHERHRSVSLILVGRRGWLYEDILNTIQTSRVRENIFLLDYVTDTDLAVLYRRARMFVFPSLYEGHGFPVMEAMASGTPVITADNSSLREIGEDAALLVDAENVEELCEAMLRIHDDSNLRRELSAKGLHRAAQYSVQNAVEAILRLYDSLGENGK